MRIITLLDRRCPSDVVRPVGGLFPLLLLLFLLTAAGARAQLQNFVVPVVPETETPEIDGTVNAEEWRHATSLTGFIHVESRMLEQRGERTHFIADDSHLYFAITTPLTEKGEEPQAHEWARDQLKEAFKDERIEINVAPPNYHKRGAFHIIVSYSGSTYDSKFDTSTESEDTSWNPEWTHEQTLTDGEWHFEGKIPVTELNVSEGNAAGAWGLNIGRAWTGSQTDQSSLNWDLHNRAEVQLIPKAPALRVDSFGDLSAGKLNLTLSARRYEDTGENENTPDEFEVTCVIKKQGNTVLRKRSSLTFGDGKTGSVTIKKTVDPGTFRLFVLVEAPEGTTY